MDLLFMAIIVFCTNNIDPRFNELVCYDYMVGCMAKDLENKTEQFSYCADFYQK